MLSGAKWLFWFPVSLIFKSYMCTGERYLNEMTVSFTDKI